MRQFVLSLVVVLMSMMASTPASAKSDKSEVDKMVPENIVVKQTTTFNDGRTLVIYYKKEGSKCAVYSPCEAKDYCMSDASKIKSTHFEVVDKAQGKLYKKASVGQLTRVMKKIVNQYL